MQHKRWARRSFAAALGLGLAGGAALLRAQAPVEEPDAGVEPVVGTSEPGGEPQGERDEPATPKSAPAGEPAAETPTAREGRDAPIRATVEDLVEEPGRYYGREVRVSGQIEDQVGPRSFTLDEDSLEATTDLFVLLPHAASGIREDTEMVVTGTVRRFVHEDLRREYDWFDATPDVVAEFESRPVIVADSLRTAGGDEILNPDIKMREQGLARADTLGYTFGDGANGDGADGARGDIERTAAILTPAAIAREPAPHYGREIIVSGKIEDVFGRTLFTLDENAEFAGPDVIVLNPRPALPVEDGANVTVSGTLRRFDWAELRSEFPWLDLKQRTIHALQDRPLIVAEAVAGDTTATPAPRGRGARPRR